MRITSTNSATDSKGVAFGLEGNLFIPVVASIMASIFLLAAVLSADGTAKWPLLVRYGFSFIPFFLTLAYILVFRFNRPPRFDKDTFEGWIVGADFNVRPRVPPHHPLREAKRRLNELSASS